MPRQRIQVTNIADFTGGLNLRADPFQLAENESPDLLNVEVDPRGGFRQRKVAAPFGNAMPAAASTPNLWAYETTTGIKSVLAHRSNSVYVSTGGNWSVAFSSDFSRHRAATFKDNCYIFRSASPYGNATGSPTLRWNGSAVTTMGETFNDTDVPNGGDVPKADCGAVWMGCLWVANTVESNVRFPNRVRFSHPNFPEDFKSFHFFDVDTGSDGDSITALVPFGDRLLVFKRRSVHAIYGGDPDSFGVYPITREAGAVSQEAVIATDVGVYFFSWPEGVFLYQGREPHNVFERIYPAILDGTIPDAYQDQVTLGWGNRRLWVSVPWGSGATSPSRCFVLDPTLGGPKSVGSWVAYDMKLRCFLEWHPPGAEATFLASIPDGTFVCKLDQSGATDNFGSGAVHVNSYYRTRFFDLGQPAIVKRWRRADIVLRAGSTAQTSVDCFVDYDPSQSTRNFRLDTKADGTTGVWDVSLWDVAVWAREEVTERNGVERGVPLGNARSIALRFNGPIANAEWGVNAVALKYVPRKVKG